MKTSILTNTYNVVDKTKSVGKKMAINVHIHN